MDDDIAAVAKEMGKVVVGLAIDGDTERLQAKFAGFMDGLTGIFDTIATLVLVKIIGFSIRQNQ